MTLTPDARITIVGLAAANLIAALIIIREPWHAFTISLVPLGYASRELLLETVFAPETTSPTGGDAA